MPAQGTIPFFWIAFYSDGTFLRQYEDDGSYHLFKEIDQSRLVKFGWFPFPPDLAEKVGNGAYSDPTLPHFVIRLKPNQRLIALRREYIHTYSYSHCLNCGFKWQWMPNRKNGEIGNAGLPIFNQDYSFYEEIGGKRVYQLICPRCRARNELRCPTCGEIISKVIDDGKIHYKCLKCDDEYPRLIQQKSARKYEDIFLLGYQETKNGRNIKFIMFIHPDGTFELNNDFNAL